MGAKNEREGLRHGCKVLSQAAAASARPPACTLQTPATDPPSQAACPRLPTTPTKPRSVGIVKNECAGLCQPVQDLLALHQQPLCTRPPAPGEALAYHPSYPEHAVFEKMWVA